MQRLWSHLLVASTGIIFLANAGIHARASSHDQRVSVAGARAAPAELVEQQTLSAALDRIDQQDLPLDRTFRHVGSGRGVTVYVFDGGILDTHPELAGRVRRGFNAYPSEKNYRCNAHGTAVAGAVAGNTLGVAPDAEIVDVKMVECRTLRGSIDAIVQGAHWVIADHAQHPGTRAVANWSFMADTTNAVPALDSAVKALIAAGIPVIVSAGNFNIDACRVAPANSPGSVVVGAAVVGTVSDSLRSDARAAETAYGPCVDIFAPGENVLLPSMDDHENATEQRWTGTSMAAGYVSGAVALFLEANPRATPATVARHLRATASSVSRIDAQSPQSGMLYVGLAGMARR
ncbi:MAG: peptidase [Gemmatimonadetes bacterium]|nr:peptidase [Gemmatimonadota bacterium]